MLDINKAISLVEKKAKKRGISLQQLCKIAGVSQSTWTRAKHGRQEIRLSNLQKMIDTVAAL